MKNLRNNIVKFISYQMRFDSLIKTRDDLVPQNFSKLFLGVYKMSLSKTLHQNKSYLSYKPILYL